MVFALLLLLESDPGEAQFDRAQRLAQEDHCDQAEPILIELSREYPNQPAVRVALGECQFRDKNYLASAESFERALAIAPADAESASMRGAALAMAGKVPEGLEQLRLVVKNNPDFEPAYRMLGMFEVQAGNTGPDVRTALEKALSLDPSDVRASYWLGEVLLAQKQFDQALVQYGAVLLAEPDSEQSLIGRAAALRASGQPQAALSDLDHVLRNNPGSVKALIGAAQCNYDLQDFQTALRQAQAARDKAVEMGDKRAASWLSARLFRLRNDPQRAQAAEREVIRIESETNSRLERFRLLQEEAAGYRRKGDFRKVVSTLEDALKIEERQDSLVVLGDAYLKLGRPEDAAACYLRALNAGPELEEIRKRLEQTRALLRNSRKTGTGSSFPP